MPQAPQFEGKAVPTIAETIDFIKRAHAGQMTDGGEEYWTHPVAVMGLLPDDVSDDVRHAALLHDVIEDTFVTLEDLRSAGYSEETIEIVRLVTRPTGPDRQTYLDWIRSIAGSGNVGAMQVKLADNRHNADPRRIDMLPPEKQSIGRRYYRSMRIIAAALRAL